MINDYADNKVEVYSLIQLKKELDKNRLITAPTNLADTVDKKVNSLKEKNNNILNEIFDFAITKKEQSLIKKRIKDATTKK